MADKRTYERLFCCECGDEVPPGKAGRSMPALQPGSNQHSSPRPHVWCTRCWEKEVAEAEARPKPHELSTPPFELHRYIFAIGEGRTDAELVSFHRACGWTVTLAELLRELTDAGKIEKRGDRRVALCAPWSKPPKLPPPPRFEENDRLHIGGVRYEVRKVFSPTELLVEKVWGHADSGSMARAEYQGDDHWAITEEFPSDADGLPAPLYKPAQSAPPATTVDAVRSGRRHGRPSDEEIDDAFACLRGGNAVPSLRRAREDDMYEGEGQLRGALAGLNVPPMAIPDEDELQADRYFTDVSVTVLQEVNNRLRNIEAVLNHLVTMDNENDVGRRLSAIERFLRTRFLQRWSDIETAAREVADAFDPGEATPVDRLRAALRREDRGGEDDDDPRSRSPRRR